jgi:hypothetical protein
VWRSPEAGTTSLRRHVTHIWHIDASPRRLAELKKPKCKHAKPPKSNAIKILPDDHNSKNDGPSLRQGLRLPVAIASHMEAYFHALSPEWRCGDPMIAGSLPAATMTLSGSASTGASARLILFA